MKNNTERMRVYMAERYARRLSRAKEALGGKCVHCGATEDLQFDHKTPRGHGDFVITYKLAGVAESKLVAELEKCQLLCGRCHNAKTQEDMGRKVAKGTHGTLSAYRHCGPPACEACRTARRIYVREWRGLHP